MPVLSRFYGIVIRMLFLRPFAAHFHAVYEDWRFSDSDHPGRCTRSRVQNRMDRAASVRVIGRVGTACTRADSAAHRTTCVSMGTVRHR